MRAVPRPRVERQIDFLTQDEARAFLDAVVDDRYRALWDLVIAVGLRWGEDAALRRSDVNLDDASITIVRSLKETRKFGRPKTAGSRRRIDLPPSIVDELRRHKEHNAPRAIAATTRRGTDRKRVRDEKFAGLVFTYENGNAMHPSNVNRCNFVPALERAGLRRIRFHDLRHTAAALRMLAGQQTSVVQNMVGHASSKTTLDIYGHLQPSVSKDAAAAYDRMMVRENT